MKTAYIVSPLRSAVGKAFRGSLANKRPDDLCADVIAGVLKASGSLDPNLVEDVIVGCAMPEAQQGINVARVAAMLAGMPDKTPGVTVNRFCSSGVQTIAMAADQVRLGDAECIMAGGTESMTMIPMMGHKIVGSRTIMDRRPEIYMSMGITAENVADRFKVSREDQDQFAFNSHQKAIKAIKEGWFKDEILPVEVSRRKLIKGTKVEVQTGQFDTDEGPRADTTVEALAKLRPVFKVRGSVTAGTASQMSDGAAMCLVWI